MLNEGISVGEEYILKEFCYDRRGNELMLKETNELRLGGGIS